MKGQLITFRELTHPGEFQFCDQYGSGEKDVALVFMCPCGCSEPGALDIRRPGFVERPSWVWDGNKEAPTLLPSIQRNSNCRWHGFLENGIWRLA